MEEEEGADDKDGDEQDNPWVSLENVRHLGGGLACLGGCSGCRRRARGRVRWRRRFQAEAPNL